MNLKHVVTPFILCLVLWQHSSFAEGSKRMTQRDIINLTLERTQPLRFPRGNRLPLYVWPLMGVGTDDDAEAERILRQLDERGLAVISSWNPNSREKSLAEGLRIGALQKKLGLQVNVNANACMHQFFNGEEATAHVTEKGGKFFDNSFAQHIKIGCPFAVKHRYPVIKEQIEYFVHAYKEKGVPLDFLFADWEIDGPIEWNGAWAASKRCKRCREHITKIDDFTEFQKALRTIRCEMQREVFANTVKAAFPKALVGNYSVNPHDGYRYWYDYYEQFVEGAPYKADQRAKYRQWFNEFPLTGYTFAMPVIYTWYPIFNWYNFDNADYRWFRALLLEASSAAKHTPAKVPIITFVHYTTTSPPPQPDRNVKQFSEEKYRELLWHMLLRGHDDFFLWCPTEETEQELVPLHQVYAASLEYREFLEKGQPVSSAVPPKPGPVVSGLKLGDRVLVRRTDFDGAEGDAILKVSGRSLRVPRVEGKCQVLELK